MVRSVVLLGCASEGDAVLVGSARLAARLRVKGLTAGAVKG